MEIPSLPRVKHGELQSIVEGAIEICSGIGVLQPAMDRLLAISPAFKDAVLKIQASAEDKAGADYGRDFIYTGAYYYSKSLTYFTFPNSEANEVAQQVWEIFEDEGLGIIRLPYDEESSAIDNRIAKVKKLNLSPLADTLLPKFISYTEESNEAFKKLALKFNEDKTDASIVKAATALVPAVRMALEGLFMMLTTFTEFGSDEEVLKAYNRVGTLLDSFR